MKLSTLALALTFSVISVSSFAKDVVLKPVNANIETQACLTAATEGFGPALRFIRKNGFDAETFSATVRCNGESLRTFAHMYRNNKVSSNAKTVALVAKNENVASKACLAAIKVGARQALAQYNLEGENIICNNKQIADFAREYTAQDVVVRNLSE